MLFHSVVLSMCSAKTFLPETHKQRFGISSEVEKAHRELSGTFTIQECINRVVEGCERLSTMRGVFFEVSEPIKSDIMKVIPWNKLEGRWFGISINGIFSIDKETEGVRYERHSICWQRSEGGREGVGGWVRSEREREQVSEQEGE